MVAPVCAIAIAACGGSRPSSTSTTTSPPATTGTPAATTPSTTGGVKIFSATVSPLGPVLANAQGRTLYVFAPDNAKKVTCVGGCAAAWPPVALASGEKAVAAGAVKQSLLGSEPNLSGGEMITYAGWRLYTYVADSSAGKGNGTGSQPKWWPVVRHLAIRHSDQDVAVSFTSTSGFD